MKKFALLGHNISYSLSPRIHKAIYRRFSADYTYELVSASASELDETVKRLTAEYAGFNVTKPHKINILRYLTADYSGIGSVNTVKVEQGGLYGYTTDGYGFTEHLKLSYGSPAGKSCLVLGAGGVARIVVPELIRAGAEVSVWNRTEERERALANEFGCKVFLNQAAPQLIVNCTSCGLKAGENPLPAFVRLDKLEFAYDTIYSPPVTDFLKFCASYAPVENGLGMLILQAIKSDEILCGFDTMSDILRLYREIKEEIANENFGD